jgi:hypothetical protein
MIPIKDLVRDGCWLKCTARNRWREDTSEYTFRMRILSFERLDYAQIGREKSLEPIEEGAVRWLMKLEVVNLCKVSVLFGHLKGEMRVVDGDGFQFEEDDAGLYFSDFAKETGLSLGYLVPKIKAQGAAIFKVPDEDTDYSLAIKDGTMGEI